MLMQKDKMQQENNFNFNLNVASQNNATTTAMLSIDYNLLTSVQPITAPKNRNQTTAPVNLPNRTHLTLRMTQ